MRKAINIRMWLKNKQDQRGVKGSCTNATFGASWNICRFKGHKDCKSDHLTPLFKIPQWLPTGYGITAELLGMAVGSCNLAWPPRQVPLPFPCSPGNQTICGFPNHQAVPPPHSPAFTQPAHSSPGSLALPLHWDHLSPCSPSGLDILWGSGRVSVVCLFRAQYNGILGYTIIPW